MLKRNMKNNNMGKKFSSNHKITRRVSLVSMTTIFAIIISLATTANSLTSTRTLRSSAFASTRGSLSTTCYKTKCGVSKPELWTKRQIEPLSISCSPTYLSSYTKSSLCARRNDRNRRFEDEEYYDDDEYYYDDDEEEDENYRYYKNKKNKNKKIIDDLGSVNKGTSLNLPSPFGRKSGIRLPESVSQALLAGVFVLGIGTGVTVDSAINTSPKDLASRDAVDQAAPNPRICSTYGASAMAFDQRVFVSFNPFNVYVAQADVKPACVLNPANVVPVLRERGLVNDKEVRSCKANMNTWAFVGQLEDLPQLSCVYKSEDAQNEFLSNPKYGIGEDVYDDDRDGFVAAIKSQTKQVKDGLTEGERVVRAKNAAMKAAKLKVDNVDTLLDDISN